MKFSRSDWKDWALSHPLHPISLAESLTLCSASQMTNPAIQNDFSYYRRTISRMRINNVSVRNNSRTMLWLHHPDGNPQLPQSVFWAGPNGKRGGQRASQPHVSVLRERDAHVKNAQRGYIKVCLRREFGFFLSRFAGLCPGKQKSTWLADCTLDGLGPSLEWHNQQKWDLASDFSSDESQWLPDGQYGGYFFPTVATLQQLSLCTHSIHFVKTKKAFKTAGRMGATKSFF